MIRPCLYASKNVDLYNFTGPCYLNSEWFPNWFFFDEMTTLRILLCVSISSAFNQLTGVFSFNTKKRAANVFRERLPKRLHYREETKIIFISNIFVPPNGIWVNLNLSSLIFHSMSEEGTLEFFHKEWFVGFFGRFFIIKKLLFRMLIGNLCHIFVRLLCSNFATMATEFNRNYYLSSSAALIHVLGSN